MVEFDNYFKKKNIIHKIIVFYLLKQNKKANRVSRTTISFIWAILA